MLTARSSLLTGALLLLLDSAASASPAGPPHPGDAPAPGYEPGTVIVPFGFDVVPLVGTSSVLPRARRVVSLNLVGGLAGGLEAFELGGAFNLHTGSVRGLQLAGAFNIVGGDVLGVQLAGAFDVVDGNFRGLQLAGALDVVEGMVCGVQMAGALNVVGGGVGGLQVAGALNVTGGELRGFQLAGAVNVARKVHGLQLSGAVNVAGERVEGAQIGVVNVAGADVEGLQLGVVNVASRASAGLGLVSIYWDGWADADLAISETTLMLVGVRHGSGTIYNVYYAGTRLDRPRDYAIGIGLGARWPLHSNIELSFDATTISTALDGYVSRGYHVQFALRPQIAWRISPAFALWAGPTLNILSTDYDEDKLDLPSIASRITGAGADSQVWFWPGFAAGVRLF